MQKERSKSMSSFFDIDEGREAEGGGGVEEEGQQESGAAPEQYIRIECPDSAQAGEHPFSFTVKANLQIESITAEITNYGGLFPYIVTYSEDPSKNEYTNVYEIAIPEGAEGETLIISANCRWRILQDSKRVNIR